MQKTYISCNKQLTYFFFTTVSNFVNLEAIYCSLGYSARVIASEQFWLMITDKRSTQKKKRS